MHILRKSLSFDKEKLKEIGRAMIKEKVPQRRNKSLPNPCCKQIILSYLYFEIFNIFSYFF